MNNIPIIKLIVNSLGKLLKKAIVSSPLKTEIACPTSSGWIEPANATGINIKSMRIKRFFSLFKYFPSFLILRKSFFAIRKEVCLRLDLN